MIEVSVSCVSGMDVSAPPTALQLYDMGMTFEGSKVFALSNVGNCDLIDVSGSVTLPGFLTEVEVDTLVVYGDVVDGLVTVAACGLPQAGTYPGMVTLTVELLVMIIGTLLISTSNW